MKSEYGKTEVKITEEMLKTPGVYIITAGTGAGKSTAVKEIPEFLPGCKILVLSPRCALVDQQTEEVYADTPEVTVRTSQGISHISDPILYIKKFDVVVMDEAHDLLCLSEKDSNNNNLVRILLHARVLICLTATDIGLSKLFKRNEVDAVKHEYPDRVWETLYAGTFEISPDLDTTIDVISRKVARGEKVLFFTDETTDIEAIKMHLLFTANVLPVVSKSNPMYKRLCKGREEEIHTLIAEQRFPEGVNVVCATRVMDVGLNIWDKEVTSVITNVSDVCFLRQCLGRKRLDEGERVQLIVMLPKSKSLSARKRNVQKILEQYDTYCNHRELYEIERVEKRENPHDIVYTTKDANGEYVERIDFCKLGYLEYLMETIFAKPTATAWKYLVEQKLGCESVPIQAVAERKLWEWQYEQTKKLKEKMAGKIMGLEEKKILEYIFRDELHGPKAFNRIFVERGWDDLHIDGDQEEKPSYIVDENGHKKRCRKRNGWKFN